jgi:D-lyxose ketol-isomerase
MVSVLVFQTKIHKIIQNQNQTSPMHAPHPNEIQDFSSCYTNRLVIDLCAQQGEGEGGRINNGLLLLNLFVYKLKQ